MRLYVKDVRWTSSNVYLLPFNGVWAGYFAGCVGLGSATITAPYMILLGMEPQVLFRSRDCTPRILLA